MLLVWDFLAWQLHNGNGWGSDATDGNESTGRGWGRWDLKELEEEVGVCGVTLKGNKTNDVNNTNLAILLNRSFTTIVHNQIALLDTGAEINVIEANIPRRISRQIRGVIIHLNL